MLPKQCHHRRYKLHLSELLAWTDARPVRPWHVGPTLGHAEVLTLEWPLRRRAGFRQEDPALRIPGEAVGAPVFGVRVDGVDVEDNASLGWDQGFAVVESERLRGRAGGFGNADKGIPEAEGVELGRGLERLVVSGMGWSDWCFVAVGKMKWMEWKGREIE